LICIRNEILDAMYGTRADRHGSRVPCWDSMTLLGHPYPYLVREFSLNIVGMLGIVG
jgi:hypothetical protein